MTLCYCFPSFDLTASVTEEHVYFEDFSCVLFHIHVNQFHYIWAALLIGQNPTTERDDRLDSTKKNNLLPISPLGSISLAFSISQFNTGVIALTYMAFEHDAQETEF